MLVSAKEESLIKVLRALPPTEADKVLNWANQLAELSAGRAIDYSDVWTDEDMADATSASMRRFDILEQHPGAPESE